MTTEFNSEHEYFRKALNDENINSIKLEESYLNFLAEKQNTHYKPQDIFNCRPYKDGSVVVKGSAIKLYRNVYLHVASGVMVSEGKMVPDSFPNKENPFVELVLKSIREGTYTSNDEPIVCFYRLDANNYFHWITQLAPSLDEVKKYYPELPVIIPNISLNDFQSSSLDLLGIKPRFKKVDSEVVFCRTVVRSSTSLYDRPNAIISQAAYRFTDKLQSICCSGGGSEKRLYVSRKDASKRVMESEYEIEQLFTSLNFEIVIPSELTFFEQVKLFSSASAVVGPHGAGLTNILFAPRGIKFLELIPTSWTANMFFSISQKRSMNYHRLYGNPTQPSTIPAIERCWDIDINKVEIAAKRFFQ